MQSLRTSLTSSWPAIAVALPLMQGCSMSSPVRNGFTDEQAIAPVAAVHATRRLPAGARLRPVGAGIASWYGPGFLGKKTASGEIFDASKLTAAHQTLPFGSKARVTNLNNGKSVNVIINDRGPYVEDRIIDLSPAAARALDMIDSGVVQVRVDVLGETSDEQN